ncbi:unnamed protein product [Phaedon cochleariae]|uniref:THD domain-containing protein n=1 Tax=Phaedon cochleariae TaxID=80249 RepID=A0A9P0DKJ2_PHACE|nr:unnamed protein product [Phaedon cochleariae]
MKTLLRQDYTLHRDTGKRDLRRAAVCSYIFLLILIVSLFVFLLLVIGRVKRLESEVEELSKVVDAVRVLDADVINAIIGFEEDEFENDDSETDQPHEDLAENLSDYMDNYYANSNDSEETPRDTREYESPFNLTKIMRESRAKRNIVAATQDGVIINSESYAQKKASNATRRYTLKGHSVTAYPGKSSSIGSPWPIYPHSYHTTPKYGNSGRHSTKAPPLVYSRPSRVMHHEKPKKRPRVVKKISWKSGNTYSDMNDDTTTYAPGFTIVRDGRRYRQRNSNLEILDEGHPRTGRIKPLPSVHYNGDTTKYVVGEHTNYLGNGHLRHHQATFVDWKASNWVDSLGMDSHFSLDQGFVTIQESGLYFVYSQIYYLDEHDTTGYRVFKNDQMILQCTLTIHSVERKLKGNTCFTAGVEHFSEGDRLSLADITPGRLSLFEKGKSFFGLVKLGDIKIK